VKKIKKSRFMMFTLDVNFMAARIITQNKKKTYTCEIRKSCRILGTLNYTIFTFHYITPSFGWTPEVFMTDIWDNSHHPSCLCNRNISFIFHSLLQVARFGMESQWFSSVTEEENSNSFRKFVGRKVWGSGQCTRYQ
jgi:hypothetical protein